MKLFELKQRLIAPLVVVCCLAGIGSQPARAQGPFAYVTNQSSNTVSVIDTSTNTVVTTISLSLPGCDGTCPSPAGLAVTPDGSRVYVANRGNGTVSVIATSTNTVSATITIPSCAYCASSSPTGVAITPDGTRAYVTDTSRAAIEVIDTNPASPTYNTVTFTITADVGNPNGPIAITPDGSAAFYTFGTGSVGRIDTSTNSHTTTIMVGSNPTGIAVTPNNAFIYVTNNGGSTVSVIPNTFPTFSPTSVTVGSGPYSVAFTPNGAFAYVVNRGSNSVSVINTTTQSVVATVAPSCIFTNQIAITPDGTQAYVADDECSRADVISTATNTAPTHVSVGSGPFGVAIGPAGTQTQTKTLGGPGTQTTFTFNTDTLKITGVNNQGGEQLTVTAFLIRASSFPTGEGGLHGFSNETCVPYGDYSASLGHDTCVEFQTYCQLSATDTTPCNFYYLMATSYDLPTDLPAIGGPDFLVAHGQPCPLTTGSTVQSIFLSYTVARTDPTTRAGSKGPSCFVATYTRGARLITTGTTSTFDGWESPVSNTELNQVKAGSVRRLKFQLFDNLGNPVTNLSLCKSFSFAPGTGNVCLDSPTVRTPWVNLSSFGIACPDGPPRSPATDETALSSADNSGLLNRGGGNYVFRWKTEKDWKGLCANVTATFDSGLVVVPAMKGFHFNSAGGDGGDEEE